MDWNDYRVLLEVVRQGQAGHAARALGISHATVSRRIADLEKHYGVNLVDRSKQKWLVTPLGHKLAERAEAMEQEAFEIERLSRSHSDHLSGNVRVSLPPTLMTYLLAPSLLDFEKEFSGISLHFIVDDTWTDLPGRKADIAIRFGQSPDGDLIGDSIGDVTWALYAGTKLYRRLKKSARDELHLAPLIETTPNTIAKWASSYFSPECKRHYVYGLEEKAMLASAEMGVTLLPRVIGESKAKLKRLEWLTIDFKTRLWVLANEDTRRSKRIGLVRRAIAERLKSQKHLLAPKP